MAIMSIDGAFVTVFASLSSIAIAFLLIYSGVKFIHRGQDAFQQHKGTPYAYSVISIAAGCLIFILLAIPITYAAIVLSFREIDMSISSDKQPIGSGRNSSFPGAFLLDSRSELPFRTTFQ